MNDAELNAMVAEKVMGFSDPVTLFAWSDRAAKKYPLFAFKKDSDDDMGDYSAYMSSEGQKVYCGKPHRVHFPDGYCTSILAAWKVVEKVSEQLCDFSLEKSGKNWTASWPGFSATEDTPERAICIAALRFCTAKV